MAEPEELSVTNTRPWNHLLDGTTVIEQINGDGDDPRFKFEFSVQKYAHAKPGDAPYFGVTPYRSIVWTGDTPEDVIARMLFECTALGRNGSLDPSAPHNTGSTPVQHAIHVLTERLLWQVQRRHEHIAGFEPVPNGRSEPAVSDVALDNEVISALATSIAALARVKDL